MCVFGLDGSRVQLFSVLGLRGRCLGVTVRGLAFLQVRFRFVYWASGCRV